MSAPLKKEGSKPQTHVGNGDFYGNKMLGELIIENLLGMNWRVDGWDGAFKVNRTKAKTMHNLKGTL